MAVPFLPTATAAAAFAIRNAVSQSAPAASATASTAATVSPAPGDVAHLDRMRRHMDRLAVARHQRHAVLALRHQHGLAIGKLHRVLRGGGDVRVGIGAAAGRFREFLAIGRQQRRAAIDREIGALGIDDHALAEFARGVDDVADHPRGQHALGIVGQQHDIGARQQRQDGVDQLLLDIGGRPAPPVPNPRAACGWRNARRRSAPFASSAAPDRKPARFRSGFPAPARPSAFRRPRPRRSGRRRCSARRARRCCARHCRRRRYWSRCAGPR